MVWYYGMVLWYECGMIVVCVIDCGTVNRTNNGTAHMYLLPVPSRSLPHHISPIPSSSHPHPIRIPSISSISSRPIHRNPISLHLISATAAIQRRCSPPCALLTLHALTLEPPSVTTLNYANETRRGDLLPAVASSPILCTSLARSWRQCHARPRPPSALARLSTPVRFQPHSRPSRAASWRVAVGARRRS